MQFVLYRLKNTVFAMKLYMPCFPIIDENLKRNQHLLGYKINET